MIGPLALPVVVELAVLAHEEDVQPSWSPGHRGWSTYAIPSSSERLLAEGSTSILPIVDKRTTATGRVIYEEAIQPPRTPGDCGRPLLATIVLATEGLYTKRAPPCCQ